MEQIDLKWFLNLGKSRLSLMLNIYVYYKKVTK